MRGTSDTTDSQLKKHQTADVCLLSFDRAPAMFRDPAGNLRARKSHRELVLDSIRQLPCIRSEELVVADHRQVNTTVRPATLVAISPQIFFVPVRFATRRLRVNEDTPPSPQRNVRLTGKRIYMRTTDQNGRSERSGRRRPCPERVRAPRSSIPPGLAGNNFQFKNGFYKALRPPVKVTRRLCRRISENQWELASSSPRAALLGFG